MAAGGRWVRGVGLVLAASLGGAGLAVPAGATEAAAPVVRLGPAPTPPAPSAIPGRLLVTFADEATAEQRAAVRARVGATEPGEPLAGNVEVLTVPTDSGTPAAAELAVGLAADPAVRSAEPDVQLSLAETTVQAAADDPFFVNGDLWGMYGDTTTPANTFGSQAAQLWASATTGSAEVLVGIVDTGLDVGHPDLAANVWTNPYDPVNGVDDDGNGKIDDVRGWDVYSADNDVSDVNGHGTHVAGTIGAVGGNATGVAGMAWQVGLVPVKVSGTGSSFALSDAVRALDYLRDLRVRHGLPLVAINASWGTTAWSPTLYDAVAAAGSAGILVVAAAGNAASDLDAAPYYPASFALPNVVAVAATTADGALASFSNRGTRTVALGAPGADVLSTYPRSLTPVGYLPYAFSSGTSMAAPHVTGAAALCRALDPDATAAEVRAALVATTRPTPALAGRTVTGGRLDVSGLGEACAPTPAVPAVPAAPSDARATAVSSSRIDVTWTDHATNETEIVVQQSVAGGTWAPAANLPADTTTWSATGLPAGTTVSFRVRAHNGAGSSAWSNTATATTRTRLFTPVTPTRLFDTRTGEGGVPAGRRQAGSVLQVTVTGRAGVPATDVAAVSLNVTVTGASEPGYVTVYGCGARPLASNLNYVPGQTVPNAAVTPVGAGGTVCFYVYGATHLLADVNGWYAAGAPGFTPVTPARLFDTRTGEGGVVWEQAAPDADLLAHGDAESAALIDAPPPVKVPATTELLDQRAGVLVGWAAAADPADRERIRSAAGAVLLDELDTTANDALELVRFPAGTDLDTAARVLAAEPLVRYAEPNTTQRLASVSNDPYVVDGRQWGALGTTGARTNPYGSKAVDAWAAGRTGSSQVLVAVLDTGVEWYHADLADNIWTNPYDPVNGRDDDGNGKVDDVRGWDVWGDDNDPDDFHGHGTHVAGTIGAVGGNATGVAGVAWDVGIVPVRISSGGSILISDEIEAIDYVIDLKRRHGLPIVAINASWGGATYVHSLYEAVGRAHAAGILVIAAAGNGGADGFGDDNDVVPTYPASFDLPNVVAVAATGPTGTLATFSNYGRASVDLSAPGLDVWSTGLLGGYSLKSGTSMATPHVVGAVAVCAAVDGTLGATALRDHLLASVTPTASLAGRTTTGGRLDVAALAHRCASKPPAGTVLRVPVTGRQGVPASGVAAVSLNVTVTQPDGPGYVTVYGCGSRPHTSNLNYVAGQTVPNAVVTPVAADGTICLYTYGATHLLADVNGWFATGHSGFTGLTPSRLFDTRDGTGAVPVGRRPHGSVLQVPVTGRNGVPAGGVAGTPVAAVSLNVTVTDAADAGYVTVYGCGTRPHASNLNFVAGQTVPNAVIAPVAADGTICLYTYGSTHLLADVNGWYAGA